MPEAPSYQDLINGYQQYYSNLTNIAARNPGPPGVPTVDNYVSNGVNDFWNNVEALAETYFLGEYSNIDFSNPADENPQTLVLAQQIIGDTSEVEAEGDNYRYFQFNRYLLNINPIQAAVAIDQAGLIHDENLGVASSYIQEGVAS